MSTTVSPWSALQGKHALNWRTHLLFAVPAIQTGLINDYSRLGGNPLDWVLIVLAGYLTTVLAIELFGQLRTLLIGKQNSWSNLVVLTLAGIVRALVIYSLGFSLGLMPQSEFWFRITAAPIYVVAIYLVFNTLVAAYLQQRELTAELKKEQFTLLQSRVEFSREIERLRLTQHLRINELIAPSLWEISKHLSDAKLSKDARNIVAALRDLNDEVLRPLSHQLADRFDPPTISTLPYLTKLGSLTLPKRSVLGQTLPVGWMALTAFVLGFTLLYSSATAIQGLITAVILTSWFGLVTYGVKTLTAKIEHSTWLGFLVSIPVGALVGLTANLFISWPTLTLPESFVLQSVAFFSLAYPSIYLIAVAQNQSQLALGQLRETVEELRLLNSQLRQQVWLDQKMLATELHGSVQAALHAAALQLAKIENPTAKDLELVGDVVDRAMGRLGQTSYLEGETFEQVIQDIAEVWEESCKISYQISDSALALIATKQSLARSTIEVMREAITNAIKHGSAKNIRVEIKVEKALLELIVENDGTAPGSGVTGYGTRVIAELTHSHNLLVGEFGVRFRATIPLGLELEL